ELAEYSVYTSDTESLKLMLDSLAADRDIAYVAVMDRATRSLASRGFGSVDALKLPKAVLRPGVADAMPVSIEGHRYLEVIEPILSAKATPGTMTRDPVASGINAAEGPIGYIRLGMSFDRSQAQLRGNLLGALSVVAALVIIAIVL